MTLKGISNTVQNLTFAELRVDEIIGGGGGGGGGANSLVYSIFTLT